MIEGILDNLPDGYIYKIGGTGLEIITNKKGVEDFRDACRKEGLPDIFVIDAIQITLDENLTTSTRFYSLKYLKKN